jgi:hypothetical protein
VTGSGLRLETSNNLSAIGYHPMPSEYDEQLDSTDTQLPGEYDLFDLMAQVTEENLHPRWILGRLSAVKRYGFSLTRVRVIRRYFSLFIFM